MEKKTKKNYQIAFYNKKAKAFFSNWNPEARCQRHYRPQEEKEGTIKLFPAIAEPVIRVTYDLNEDWEVVKIDYSVFSNLLKEQGIIDKDD